MRPGAQRRGWCKLTPQEQRRFDDAVESHSFSHAARLFGLTATQVDRVYGGGAADADTIERIRRGLEDMPA